MRRSLLLVACVCLMSAAAASPVFAQLKQVAYIKASNAKMGDHFGNGGTLEGHAVALSGDGNTLAVGAPYESSSAKGINGNQTDTSLYSAGAVYVFVRTNNAWSQQAYIKASNPGQSDHFGFVVSLSQNGNTLAVSAPGEKSAAKGINGDQSDDSIPNAGAVYVFTRTGANWSQQAYVKASNAEADDHFGWTVALSSDGNAVLAGAPHEDGGSTHVNGNQADNSVGNSGAV